MARAVNSYIKLPGRGLRRAIFAISATRCRLWLGADHLLSVDYTLASEEYHRFYFRDIEALTIRRTPHRQVWNWILMVLILLTAGPFFIGWRSEGNGGLAVAGLGVALFWAIFIVVNSVRGAACRTYIRTAVQTEELPSLGRLPVARKVFARLRPLIQAAQGEATPEEFEAASWIAPEGANQPGAPAPKPIRADKGWWHGSLFGLLLLETILTIVSFLFFHQPISSLGMLVTLLGCVVCIAALMRQGNTDLPSFVRQVTKFALGYYLLKCLAGYVFMMIFAVGHPGKPLLTGLEMVDEPGFAAASAISVAFAAVIGLAGLFPLLAHLRNRPNLPAA